MLQILDLFGPEQSVVDAESICAQLAFAPATAYRYIKELCDAACSPASPRDMRWPPHHRARLLMRDTIRSSRQPRPHGEFVERQAWTYC